MASGDKGSKQGKGSGGKELMFKPCVAFKGLCIQKVVPSHVEMLMLAQEAKRKKNLIKRRQNSEFRKYYANAFTRFIFSICNKKKMFSKNLILTHT